MLAFGAVKLTGPRPICSACQASGGGASLNLEVASTTELDAVDAVRMALGALLLAFGVVSMAVGLSTPLHWGLTVYGVVLALLGAATLFISATTEGQTTKT